ncbi:MAG TPA: RusA family crossover junction endodeoxyribonuclease [Planctomycetaceae bacterium]|nr:RusA family crossover junction endodeoxyribonuclease [Planctomycetaceae bacterium]
MMADSGESALSFPHRSVSVATLHFVLPFPPSVNRYYRHVGYRTLLSREGREYRKRVCALLAGRVGQSLSGPLEVQLDLYPPDRRRRDWDNFQKAIWDALQHAGVYLDDSQVKRAVVEMHEPDRASRAEIMIQPRCPKQEP